MDPDLLNPNLDPAFQVNPDPDTDPDLDPIQIQGFVDQKLKKKIQLIFFSFFYHNLEINYP